MSQQSDPLREAHELLGKVHALMQRGQLTLLHGAQGGCWSLPDQIGAWLEQQDARKAVATDDGYCAQCGDVRMCGSFRRCVMGKRATVGVPVDSKTSDGAQQHASETVRLRAALQVALDALEEEAKVLRHEGKSPLIQTKAAIEAVRDALGVEPCGKVSDGKPCTLPKGTRCPDCGPMDHDADGVASTSTGADGAGNGGVER